MQTEGVAKFSCFSIKILPDRQTLLSQFSGENAHSLPARKTLSEGEYGIHLAFQRDNELSKWLAISF